ncbi:hypothetical protein OZ13_03210 [Xanthomonas cannabis pv. cannabis]|nr:hypothetical protein OZ10_11355 [Xanthomonas cannabis pv. cannabis]KHL58922.1 hypothetical protein OZ13_03210 [Xanthomonas cannabis pv. cannabis]
MRFLRAARTRLTAARYVLLAVPRPAQIAASVRAAARCRNPKARQSAGFCLCMQTRCHSGRALA